MRTIFMVVVLLVTAGVPSAWGQTSSACEAREELEVIRDTDLNWLRSFQDQLVPKTERMNALLDELKAAKAQKEEALARERYLEIHGGPVQGARLLWSRAAEQVEALERERDKLSADIQLLSSWIEHVDQELTSLEPRRQAAMRDCPHLPPKPPPPRSTGGYDRWQDRPDAPPVCPPLWELKGCPTPTPAPSP